MRTQSDLSSKQKPKKLVLEYFNRVWHHLHELDAIDELMTKDYTITTAGSIVKGRDDFKNWVKDFKSYFLKLIRKCKHLF